MPFGFCVFGLRLLCLFILEERRQNVDYNADANSAVGDVESRPAVVYKRQVHVYEVYDVPVVDSVEEVAEHAACEHSHCRLSQRCRKAEVVSEKPHSRQRYHGDGGEQVNLPREYSPRRALVGYVDKVEEVVYNCNGLVFATEAVCGAVRLPRNFGDNRPLCQLVEGESCNQCREKHCRRFFVCCHIYFTLAIRFPRLRRVAAKTKNPCPYRKRFPCGRTLRVSVRARGFPAPPLCSA